MKKIDPLLTACDLKWNYPIFNMERGEFRSCCRTPAVKITEEDMNTNEDVFLNSPKQKESRAALLRGEKHSDCQSCWNLEASGTTSPRHDSKEFWSHLRRHGRVDKTANYDETKLLELISDESDVTLLEAHTPYMLEINIGSTCDMKCMYCTHHYSTQWAAERIKYGEISQSQYDIEFPKAPSRFNEKFWEWFNNVGRHSVVRIGVIGGEPLITPEFYTFVNKLIDSISEIQPAKKNKIMFWVVTNLNTPPNYLEKFFKYFPSLTEVFDVEILVSMESVGPRAEYIRNGVNWERFTSNMEKLLQKTELKFDFGVIMSLNVLNITSLQDFIMYTEELYKKYGRPVGLKQNIISFPDWQSPMLLTPDFADYLTKCAEYMKPRAVNMPVVADPLARWDQYATFLETIADSIRNNTDDKSALRKKFAEWFGVYDERRKLNMTETFPEYTDFYNLCKSI